MVPFRELKFDNMHDVLNDDFNERYLVDVMGEITHVGNYHGYERNGVSTDIRDIEIESQGKKIKCLLYGEFVKNLDEVLSGEDNKHVVVIILLGAVTRHQGENQLTTGLNCTTVMFNPNIHEAVCYRDRLFECDAVQTQVMNVLLESFKSTEEDEFLKLFPRANLENLAACKSRTIFIVYAAIEKIVNTDDWYKLLMNVADNTGSATMIIFDRDGISLINKKSNEILDDMKKNGCMEHPPKEIGDLIHKEILFKVEGKDRFGKWFKLAFNVLKICMDPEIISKFKSNLQVHI
ncbi:uncharacterized protein LOC130736868 [Lotus japonicus]|uniref:uncharacterized protein LOC130736868 n=1 Tax=Lotus japonicus TaxID=34305 RepID=UPI0025846DED|nr:uncharacterized protein LOC130736868 [Lotus japonicus]